MNTSSPPQLVAIISAVSRALLKSEEQTAEILGSFDSLSATFQGKTKLFTQTHECHTMKNTQFHNLLLLLAVYHFRLGQLQGVPGVNKSISKFIQKLNWKMIKYEDHPFPVLYCPRLMHILYDYRIIFCIILTCNFLITKVVMLKN